MIRAEVVAELAAIIMSQVTAGDRASAALAELQATARDGLYLGRAVVLPTPDEWRTALRDAAAQVVRSVIERDPFGCDPRLDRERLRWGAEIAELNRPAIEAMRRQAQAA